MLSTSIEKPPLKPGAEATPVSSSCPTTAGQGAALRRLAIFTVLLMVAFAKPLLQLIRISLNNELYSHIVLIPVVTGSFIWLKRADLKRLVPARSGWAILPFLLGTALLIWRFEFASNNGGAVPIDLLPASVLSVLMFLIVGGLLFLGVRYLRTIAFPIGLLIFLVPFPVGVEHAIEVFFQHTSAEVASWLFGMTLTPVFRHGLSFDLPGISIRVAQECSGIRSSLVLFITSLIASHLFLRSPWKRAFLTFLVIPVAIVRNAFRIVTIGLLCTHVDSKLIDSPIHHHGGPVFFILSLIPFSLVLYWFRRSETPDEIKVS